jgi:hypothetical protein
MLYKTKKRDKVIGQKENGSSGLKPIDEGMNHLPEWLLRTAHLLPG